MTRLVAHLRWRPSSASDGQNARRARGAEIAHKRFVRELIGEALMAASWPRELPGPAVCLLHVRQQLGPLPDDDNVRGMLKVTRDAIAAWFGVDDGPSGPISWEYVWDRGPDGLEIEIDMTLEES